MTASSGPTVDFADAHASTRTIGALGVCTRACWGRSAAGNTLSDVPTITTACALGKKGNAALATSRFLASALGPVTFEVERLVDKKARRASVAALATLARTVIGSYPRSKELGLAYGRVLLPQDVKNTYL